MYLFISAFGNFDTISLFLIEDYYFGNFYFSQYSRFIRNENLVRFLISGNF
jgi:hypothetical protein